MQCFYASILYFLWFLYITHINNFPGLSFSRIYYLFFADPSAMMDITRHATNIRLECQYCTNPLVISYKMERSHCTLVSHLPPAQQYRSPCSPRPPPYSAPRESLHCWWGVVPPSTAHHVISGNTTETVSSLVNSIYVLYSFALLCTTSPSLRFAMQYFIPIKTIQLPWI
jgi:hypothetical protein